MPQEAPGRPRKLQETAGSPRIFQEAPGSPRRPQDATGGPSVRVQMRRFDAVQGRVGAAGSATAGSGPRRGNLPPWHEPAVARTRRGRARRVWTPH
eukprot:4414068-Pyramimonas_sp.AAC.1